MKDSEKTIMKFMYVVFFTGIVTWIAFLVYMAFKFWELIKEIWS